MCLCCCVTTANPWSKSDTNNVLNIHKTKYNYDTVYALISHYLSLPFHIYWQTLIFLCLGRRNFGIHRTSCYRFLDLLTRKSFNTSPLELYTHNYAAKFKNCFNSASATSPDLCITSLGNMLYFQITWGIWMALFKHI